MPRKEKAQSFQKFAVGFTLIETLIAISIFAVLIIVVSMFFTKLYKEQASDILRINRIETAGRAVEIMGNEIRKMNRAEDGTFYIELAQNQDLIFYSDVDNDGLTEKIEYNLSGTDIERKMTEPGESLDYSGDPIISIVASDVQNDIEPIFTYYDENYTGSEDPMPNPVNVASIRTIGISLYINTNQNSLPIPLRIETKVSPRNLKIFD